MSFGLQTVVRYQAQIQGKHFMVKGLRKHPVTGKDISIPGGQWHRGVEGRWVDLGTLTEQAVLVSAWKILLVKIRMELHEIFKFLRGKI